MRLVAISDIHGNLKALERAFVFIDKMKVDGIIWCGDYITDILLAPQVLEFIRLKNASYNHWIVKGNREDYLISYDKGITSNFDCVDATGSLFLTYNSLHVEDLDYISNLPDFAIVDIKNCPKIYVSHKLNNNTNYRYNVFGHVHKQCLYVKDNKKFINPGSIGQTFSGSPGLEFALLELVDNEWCTHFYHMSYDFNSVIDFIRNSDLSNCKFHWSEMLIKTLETGNSYSDRYVDNVRKLAFKCGIEADNLNNIPEKLWNYVYDRLK